MPVPIVAAPSLKVTVPAAEESDTVAVKVMLEPTTGVALDTANVVVVDIRLNVTVCVKF